MAEMAKIENSLKINADIYELMTAGVIKYFAERYLAKYIGNGTLKSGLIKLAVPIGADMLGMSKYNNNFFYKATKTAFIVDGAEDIVKWVMDTYVDKSANNSTQNNYI